MSFGCFQLLSTLACALRAVDVIVARGIITFGVGLETLRFAAALLARNGCGLTEAGGVGALSAFRSCRADAIVMVRLPSLFLMAVTELRGAGPATDKGLVTSVAALSDFDLKDFFSGTGVL